MNVDLATNKISSPSHNGNFTRHNSHHSSNQFQKLTSSTATWSLVSCEAGQRNNFQCVGMFACHSRARAVSVPLCHVFGPQTLLPTGLTRAPRALTRSLFFSYAQLSRVGSAPQCHRHCSAPRFASPASLAHRALRALCVPGSPPRCRSAMIPLRETVLGHRVWRF